MITEYRYIYFTYFIGSLLVCHVSLSTSCLCLFSHFPCSPVFPSCVLVPLCSSPAWFPPIPVWFKPQSPQPTTLLIIHLQCSTEFLPQSHLGSTSPSNLHEGWLVQQPTSGPKNTVLTPIYNTSVKKLPRTVLKPAAPLQLVGTEDLPMHVYTHIICFPPFWPYVPCIWCVLYSYSYVTFSKGLARDRGCKLVLTWNLYAWHLFYILYETMYNVFVPVQ